MIWLVQLVFDCRDPDAIMQFWGQALGYRNSLIGVPPEDVRAFREANPQFDGRGRIDDLELRRPPVYIQRVPETKAGRNRIRLEVAAPSAERDTVDTELRRLGASDAPGNRELRDIEGNEFTLVDDDDDGTRRLRSVVIDALDPTRMLSFWSAATGYVASEGRCDPQPGQVRIEDGTFIVAGQRVRHVTGVGATSVAGRLFDLVPGFTFVQSNEPKIVKNRLHVDLNSTDVEADLERLLSLGAAVLRWDSDRVLADPEGNEFCLSGPLKPPS